jgi:hypothetical protein
MKEEPMPKSTEVKKLQRGSRFQGTIHFSMQFFQYLILMKFYGVRNCRFIVWLPIFSNAQSYDTSTAGSTNNEPSCHLPLLAFDSVPATGRY